MGFEDLGRIKSSVKKFSELAKIDDQLGFSQNQKLSGLIMQIEHKSVTLERLSQLSKDYEEYVTSWLEHIRNSSLVIRNFSVDHSNEIDSELKKLEDEIKEFNRELKTTSITEDSTILISTIKKHGSELSKLYNKCKLHIEHIKKELKDISNSL